MAITMTMVIPGTKDLYDSVNAEMGTDPSNLPDGLIAHYASVTPDGIRIFDVTTDRPLTRSAIDVGLPPFAVAFVP